MLRTLTPCLALLFTPWLCSQSPVSTYEMEVELNEETRELVGRQTIKWRNATSGETQELRFHMYLNAFRDLESTHMREAGPGFRALWSEEAGEFGGIQFLELEVLRADGARRDLSKAWRYVQPDDDNKKDATVLSVPLGKPVKPGETLEIRTKFKTALPKAYRRSGWAPGNTFYCMHWFPKLGVLEDGKPSSWNCHQFHAVTEFYADFSDYEVTIIVPEGHEVGATGGEAETSEDGRKHTFKAKNVHDFAWVSSRRFHRHVDEFGPVRASEDPVAVAVAKQMGVDVSTFDLPATKIILLLLPEHDSEQQRDKHLRSLRAAMRFLGLRYGKYPYSAITVVDSVRRLAGGRSYGGGMEYPMLITAGTSLFPHSRRLSPEGVVAHEFGHQYFYGLTANNEFEEAWLDEGFTTYNDGRIQDLAFGVANRASGQPLPVQTSTFGLLTFAGKGAGLKGVAGPKKLPLLTELRRALPAVDSTLEKLRFDGTLIPESHLLDLIRAQPTLTFFREARMGDAWVDRRRLLEVRNPDPMVRPGWQYVSGASYAANSYRRPATLLRTMERMVGHDRWWHFLRTFHQQHRYKHATTAGFLKMLEGQFGKDAASFFRAAMTADAELDYGIAGIEPRDGRGAVKRVTIRRFGNLNADVTIRFKFSGRAAPIVREMSKDHADYRKVFTFDDAGPGGAFGDLLEVWVDPPRQGAPWDIERGPAGVFIMDTNLLNNAWQRDRNPLPGRYRSLRLLLQSQAEISFGGLFG